MNKRIQCIEYDHENNRTTNIEEKVYCCCSFCILLVPILEMIAVTQVPMFCPIMIGNAVLKLTAPVAQSACKIPTDAEEL